MKSRILTCIAVMTLFATLAIPVGLSGQKQDDKPKHHHYKLIDLGTFGGPSSGFGENFLDFAGGAAVQVLSNQGAAVGFANTSTPDPLGFLDNGFYVNGLQWRDGNVTKLSPASEYCEQFAPRAAPDSQPSR